MNTTHFYKDKPIFGLDIGFKSIKVMQMVPHNKNFMVTGYGFNRFRVDAVDNGTVVDFDELAGSIQTLLSQQLIGDITTRRVAFSVPSARTFTRILTMPKLASKDLFEAVRLEAEQYIPVAIEDLYIDYEILKTTDKEMQVMAVAIPRTVIDSYMTLAELLGLEVIAMESTLSATARLFRHTDQTQVPTVLIDFGSISSDITIYDNGLIVTGTVPGGGDDFTTLIAGALGVTHEAAHIIKVKYGLNVSKKQHEISTALTPVLDQLTKEIKRMVRYYEERSNTTKKIDQIVTLGGGSNMPGLSEHLTSALRMPVHSCNPWGQIGFGRLSKPNALERSIYMTAAGLALINPKELFT